KHRECGRCMLNEEFQQFLVLAQVGLNTLSIGDVLDSAAHEGGPVALIHFEAAEAVNPALGTVVGTDNAILLVEFGMDFDGSGEVRAHHLAIAGMNDGEPALYAARISGSDTKNLIEHA